MKFKVNENLCIGCGACVAICPEVFALNDEGLAYIIAENNNVNPQHEESALEALSCCPTDAILNLEKD